MPQGGSKMRSQENSGFGHSTGTDAPGAHSHALVGLSIEHTDTLKVGVPAAVRPVIGVADPVAVHWALLTYFTTCHEADLLK